MMRVILLLAYLISMASAISIPSDMLDQFIFDRCYNQTFIGSYLSPLMMGQKEPVGASVENTIALIEKIESKRPDFSAQQLAILLLKRFHIDGLQTYGNVHEPSTLENDHRRITEQVIGTQTGLEFPEDVLTEDEKCALFFTISHTVNETARYDDNQADIYDRILVARAPTRVNTPQDVKGPAQSGFLNKNEMKPVIQPNHTNPSNMTKPAPPPPHQSQSAPLPAQSQSEPKKDGIQSDQPKVGDNRSRLAGSVHVATRSPREIGVASYRFNRKQAIAMNRVLLGAAVGLINPPPRSIREIAKFFAPNINIDKIVDGQLDPLMAVTLSDLLGIDAGFGLQNPTGVQTFGADGEWNKTCDKCSIPCSTTYRLRINSTLATLAEMRGGIDGYNIGRKIKEVIDKNPQIPLSQILRMYYSPRGLMSDSGYCNRGYPMSADISTKLQHEAENYLRVWNVVRYDGRFPDNKLTGYIAGSWNQFAKYLKVATDKVGDDLEFCLPSVGSDMITAPCETPSDVFFMMDNNGNFTHQTELMIQVLKTLDLRRSGSTASVLVNAQGGQLNVVDDYNSPLNVPLAPIVYNMTSSQCASCRVSYFDNRITPVNDRPLLLELINKTLMEYEMKRADLPGVPSKSFVWFEYGNLRPPPTEREQRKKYDDFKWRLRYEHRDVPLFLAALNKEPVKDLIRRDEDFIDIGTSGIEDIRMKGQKLAVEICKTPATFQHNECRTKKSQDKVYEGFMTPGYKQYWAMYPEFFIKSYDIELKFKAESAKVKVCFDRYANPERDERKCQESKNEGDEIKFSVKNPCDGKTYENCQPFYFTILLNTQSVSSMQCTDVRCKSLDQMKFTFTHSGISCNSGLNILPLWSFQIICFILFLITYFAKN